MFEVKQTRSNEVNIRIFFYNFIIVLFIFFQSSFSFSKDFLSIRIIDGDTIVINKKKIRLHGIDAPEKNQICKNIEGNPYYCGIISTKILKKIIGKSKVNCLKKGKDRYSRIIGVCFINKVNINQKMVKLGWALAYRKYSKDYVIDEKQAQENKLGLWSGKFTKPWIWRKNIKK